MLPNIHKSTGSHVQHSYAGTVQERLKYVCSMLQWYLSAAGLPGDNPFDPAPTGEADRSLAGTQWSSNGMGGGSLHFNQEGNTVFTGIQGGQTAHYTVNGSAITFDISRSVAAFKKITLASYISSIIEGMQKEIAKIEKQLNSGSLDPQTKTKLEKELKHMEDGIKTAKKAAEALEKGNYTKFEGTFNADKTELTISNFPVVKSLGSGDVSVTRQEVTLTKLVQP